MTLIMNAAVGGLLAVMTADTRQTMSVLGVEMLYKDDPNKVEFLTGYTLIGAGGDSSAARELKESVKKQVGTSDTMEKCGEAFKSSIDELKRRHEKTMEDDSFLQARIIGFSSKGEIHEVSYQSGDDVNLKIYKTGELGIGMISVSEDHEEAIFKNIQPPQFSEQGSDPSKDATMELIKYLTKIHGASSYIDDFHISAACNYYAIYISAEDRKVRHLQGTFDTTELHEEFTNILK